MATTHDWGQHSAFYVEIPLRAWIHIDKRKRIGVTLFKQIISEAAYKTTKSTLIERLNSFKKKKGKSSMLSMALLKLTEGYDKVRLYLNRLDYLHTMFKHQLYISQLFLH